jgi:hypothetical protein
VRQQARDRDAAQAFRESVPLDEKVGVPPMSPATPPYLPSDLVWLDVSVGDIPSMGNLFVADAITVAGGHIAAKQ